MLGLIVDADIIIERFVADNDRKQPIYQLSLARGIHIIPDAHMDSISTK